MDVNQPEEAPEPLWMRTIGNVAMTGLMTLWWIDVMLMGAVMNLPFFLWRLVRRQSFKAQVYKFLENYHRIDQDGVEVCPIITHCEASGYPFYYVHIAASLLGPGETISSTREIKVSYGTKWRGTRSFSFNFQSNRTWAWNKREFEKFLTQFDRPDEDSRFFKFLEAGKKNQDELGK